MFGSLRMRVNDDGLSFFKILEKVDGLPLFFRIRENELRKMREKELGPERKMRENERGLEERFSS